MFWIILIGPFVLWLLGAISNFGGDFIDLLLVLPVAAMLFQLLPRRRAAE